MDEMGDRTDTTPRTGRRDHPATDPLSDQRMERDGDGQRPSVAKMQRCVRRLCAESDRTKPPPMPAKIFCPCWGRRKEVSILALEGKKGSDRT